MSDEADHLEEAYWVARLRAKGYTVQAGAGTGGIPSEPEVAFTPPVDRDGVDSMHRRSASAVKQMPEHADDPAVPDWVCRMRADGYTVRIGTDPTPLPLEPEDHFVPPVPDEPARREEPYWVAGLRAKGYTVRVGTGTGGIPFEPEVAFTPPYPIPRGWRARVIGIVRKLWKGGAVFKRHTTLPDRHAPFP